LVNSGEYQFGAAYFNRTYNLTDGFLVQFDVVISNNTANDTTNGSDNAYKFNKPGDGFTFIAQQDDLGCEAVGAQGFGIGYSGIINAIAVEFDVYFNEVASDPSADHIAVQASPYLGEAVEAYHDGPSLVQIVDVTNTPFALYPDQPYPFNVSRTIKITYDGLSTEFEVQLDSRTVILLNQTSKVTDLSLEAAYLGFTASTGGYWETVEIKNFYAQVPYRSPSPSPSLSPSPSNTPPVISIP